MKIKVPLDIETIAKTMKEAGYKTFVVGGAVRDSIMKIIPMDWDLATDAKPEQVVKLFKRTVPTGIKHGTVTVMIGKIGYEITTFRIDGTYSNNRHPDKITYTSDLFEDLRRRDFTINAIAYDVFDDMIHDPFHGIDDISSKAIRCIGVAQERFEEDALRCMRACRFASQLGFEVDAPTMQGLRECSSLIQNVSAERIRDELIKILSSPKPSVGLAMMLQTGLMEFVIPELLEGVGVGQKGAHCFDVWNHSLLVCDGSPLDNLVVRTAALLHDVGKPKSQCTDKHGLIAFHGHEHLSAKMALTILRRLKFPNVLIEKTVHLIEVHMLHYESIFTDAAVRRMIRKIRIENFDDFLLLKKADAYGKEAQMPGPEFDAELLDRVNTIKKEKHALGIKDLAVNGKDLMDAGIPSGKNLGQILGLLLESVTEDPVMNDKETLIKLAVNIYKNVMTGNEPSL